MRRYDPRRWSLARQVLALVAAALVVAVTGGVVAAYLQARSESYRAARDEVLSVALSVASAPSVRDGVTAADPTAVLQGYAEQVRTATGTDFVVIMDRRARRFTHPDRRRIGGTFLGHTAPALAGRAFTETYTGTLGPSVRAVVPVRGADGDVVGLVAVGITRETVGRTVGRQLPALVGAGALALVLGTGGAVLLGRRLRRQTHGMGPQELGRMYEFYDAVLHAVREGLLLLDPGGRLQLVNDEGRRLLDLPPDAVGRRVADLGLPPELAAALADRGPRTDDVQLSADRVLVVSSAPARWAGRDVGTVVTLRDHTDLLALTGELDSVRGFTESLRSQAHEAANRLHTVVALIELGRTDRALEFATAELAGVQELTDRVVGAVSEPVLAALLLGKAAQATERGVELVIDAQLDAGDAALDPRDLVTIVGNLLDNALDAAVQGDPPRQVRLRLAARDGALVVEVADSGPGIAAADADRVFDRDWSTRGPGRGLGLALVRQAVARQGGTVTLLTDGATADGATPEATIGARFRVVLPLRAAGTPGAGASVEEVEA